MTTLDIPHHRLYQQGLTRRPFTGPVDVVSWFGAVQSQDYAGGKWALGLRTKGLFDADMDQAFNEGAILRTHVMRPTWHFVTPADIRWLLELTAPRVKAVSAYYLRKLEIDDALVTHSNDVLVKAMQGGKQLTRSELVGVFDQAGINTKDLLRFGYLVICAELDAVVVSGGRRGKQFTYALLDERAPEAKSLPHDEALAELARRYFTSHGPATLKDYVWWSGLTVSEANAGLEMAKSHLMAETINDQTYWLTASTPTQSIPPTAYLLPNYDEYTVGYADRSAIYDSAHDGKGDPRGSAALNYVIVIDGQVAGMWRRTFKKGTVEIELKPFRAFSDAENQAVAQAAQHFGEFVGLSVVLQ